MVDASNRDVLMVWYGMTVLVPVMSHASYVLVTLPAPMQILVLENTIIHIAVQPILSSVMTLKAAMKWRALQGLFGKLILTLVALPNSLPQMSQYEHVCPEMTIASMGLRKIVRLLGLGSASTKGWWKGKGSKA
mmetsp:Transcript_37478/g.76441  ORF Transcript_37478/g.76441 Transcript_37478/m.76441 type:complete len:134 (-) Transcript_37478:159-560(-)